MGFPRQEYRSGLPFSSPGDLPEPGVEPASLESPALQADSLPFESPGKPNYIFVSSGHSFSTYVLIAFCVLGTLLVLGVQ